MTFAFADENAILVDYRITTEVRRKNMAMTMHNPAHPGEILRGIWAMFR